MTGGDLEGIGALNRGRAMDESTRVLEMVVSQLDKRMGFIEQNLVEIRGEIAQLRGEFRGEIGQVRGELGQLRTEIAQMRSALTAEMRTTLRWMIATMVALFGVAMPVWMWVLGAILKLR